MGEPFFVLLQSRPERIEPEVLRDVLMNDGGLPKIDAARASLKARGILAERLTYAQAERCRAGLVRRGIISLILPAEQLPAWSRPVLVHWLGVANEGLFVPTDYYGSGGTIPWASVFVVSSGLVLTATEERVATTTIDSSQSAEVTEWKTKHKQEHQHVTEILGLTDVGQTLHFRMAASRLHPQQVPAGGPAATRFQKYLLLLDDVVAGATQAQISPETRQILAERREVPREIEGKKPYMFDERSFESYNRWLLALVMLREQGTG